MGIVTAFLNGLISSDTELFLELPDELDGIVAQEYCAKILKALYGLKQSPREWHKVLTEFLRELGFEPYLANPLFA